MDKLTKKEEIIVKNLVKKFSKDELEGFIDDYIENGVIPQSLKTIINMIIGEPISRTDMEGLTIQYLHYVTLFYEDIVEGNLTNDIERAKSYNLTVESTESQVIYRDYTTSFVSVPSLLERISNGIKDNFWESDFTESNADYGDSKVVDEKFTQPKESRYSYIRINKIN